MCICGVAENAAHLLRCPHGIREGAGREGRESMGGMGMRQEAH